MLSLAFPAVAILSTLLPTALGQTYTACNPLNTTGCPDMPALGGNATFDFTDELYNKIWTKKNQGDVDWTEKGTTFSVKRSGDSPQLVSNFYMLFGRLEVILKAASGQGIISTAILQSECLDEIDWEFAGSKSVAMTNYFGKGDQVDPTLRGKDFDMKAPQDDFHNYTIDWTKDRIQWWLDGKMIRELLEADAIPDANHFPQTPMNIRIGIWAAGDVENNNNGTVEWAGGETDFDKGPFTMYLQNVYAKDYTSAKEYSWEDMDSSGSWEKVKVIEGKSETMEEVESPSGVRNRFNALSKEAKIAIVVSVLGAVAIGVGIFLFVFIKRRRAGRREAAAYEAQQNKEAAELIEYQGQQMGSGKLGYNRI